MVLTLKYKKLKISTLTLYYTLQKLFTTFVV